MKRYDFVIKVNTTVDETHELGKQVAEEFDSMTPQQIAEEIVQFPGIAEAFEKFNDGGTFAFLNISEDQSQGSEEVRED